MRSVYLIGVDHTNPNEKDLIHRVIFNTEPDVIFIEEGDERFKFMENDMDASLLANVVSTRITDYTVRGRMMSRIITTQGLINSVRTGTLTESVDMEPAYNLGQEMNIDVVPIDMNISTIMNRLGEETLNISNFKEFSQNINSRINSESPREEHNINDLESLRKYVNRSKNILPNFHKVMIEERNNYMIREINQSMQHYDTGVAIVGAAHVPGMLDMLKSMHYNTEVYL